MTTPALDVIMLNWRSAGDCTARMADLHTWQMPLRIWLVDNDGSLHGMALRAHERLLMPERNLGFGGGVNFALCHIKEESDAAPATLLLNPDAIVDEHTVATLMQHVTSQARIAAAGPRLIETDAQGKTKIYCGGRDPIHHLNTRVECAQTTPIVQGVDYVPGTVAVINRVALREVGEFDEHFFFSVEMADWCLRARQKQWRAIIAGNCTAAHCHRPDRAEIEGAYLYYSLRNRLLMCAKHGHLALMTLWIARYGLLCAKHRLRGNTTFVQWIAKAAWHGLQGRGGAVRQ